MPKSWLANLRSRLGDARPDGLGILAFEAAAAMSRLVSLYRSLADAEFRQLRSDAMRAEGVAYLTSTDQVALLRLACGELVADLDRAVDTAARVGARCSSVPFLHMFDRVYAEAKNGSLAQLDVMLGFSRGAAKRFKKMERHVAATAKLYAEMNALNELEASERRMEQWKRHSGPIPAQSGKGQAADQSEPLKRELKSRRHKVRRLMEDSLWSVAVHKAAKLMAKAALAILARISSAFGAHVPTLPPLTSGRARGFTSRPFGHSSGQLQPPAMPAAATRHSAPILRSNDTPLSESIKPSTNTVGGSGMELRYANVILSSEMLLTALRPADDDDVQEGIQPSKRGELYQMLPVTICATVKAKLRECWRRGSMDEGAEEERRRAVERTLRWLAPMARDTVRWHDERSMDGSRRFAMQPRALMVQTLHFADRAKTDAAVVEVLVGLSCMCWYVDERRRAAWDE